MNAPSAPMQLLDAVRHHRELPHQLEAWQLLQRSLTAEQLSTFAVAFRSSAVEQTATRPASTPARGGLIELPVPYLSQNDSSTGQGSRMCFASTCAMAAAFLRRGCLNGCGQLDDHYLALVQRHGDTTETSAQVSALQSLGIKARFRTDGAIDALIEELQRGIPCPVGWLHKGLAPAPHGGGHWSLVIGWDPLLDRDVGEQGAVALPLTSHLSWAVGRFSQRWRGFSANS